ncbi:hypothetical protein TNCT_638481 [Trichonephila clavata]|uniref:DUF5679 domain-containing protein n=1 Tax=Trichonephila clavata TaxID=2740835 RepID=A0A8X6KLD9_TRICU|nr:hypothetical protein TNCT_638481 [Trichonephila clavata]
MLFIIQTIDSMTKLHACFSYNNQETMETTWLYCPKCQMRTETLNTKAVVSKKNQPMMQGNCVKCQTKKSGFVKRKQDHEFSGTDSSSPMS